jgi:hypothetical protein
MRTNAAMLVMLCAGAGIWGQQAPLLPEKDMAAVAGEISGATAKRNLEAIAAFHRQRGSQGFHAAAELVAAKLKEYGLSDVQILQFPADGKIFYGTQRSRPAWDGYEGYLTEQLTADNSECKRGWQGVADKKHGEGKAGVLTGCLRVFADYHQEPVALAEDSESADVTAELVDVGSGTKAGDYAGKDVKGKMVLVSEQPGAVQDLAVGKFGAVGIVSHAQNQKTAWWGENLDAIRWGHLETFSPNKTFAFMVSLRTARALQERLAKAEKIELHAVVKAGQHAGYYEVVTATIPGADEKSKNHEIAYSCHLDHQQPGANDNASGCATILEVARTLEHLIAAGKLARPARTIRFIFPPEIEGTMALLNGRINYAGSEPVSSKSGQEKRMDGHGYFDGPQFAKNIEAVVHMDMVGGGPETKAVFHVTRGPMSLPSFVQDVAWAFAEWVNQQTYAYAATGKAGFPLVEAEGGKEPLRAEYSAYTMGSDHDVYEDSSFGIPAIYLNDWPDRFIHTNLDTPANIDATKLKRVGLIGAASGYFLAGMGEKDLEPVYNLLKMRTLETAKEIHRKRADSQECDGGEIERFERDQVRPLVESVARFVPDAAGSRWAAWSLAGANIANNSEGMCLRTVLIPEGTPVYRRRASPKGPMTVFGYDYFAAECKKRGHTAPPKLLEYQGLWGAGEEYAYEVLNFVNGTRTVYEVRDAVSAEYGPVDVELVVEYLKVLEEIGLVEKTK